MINGFIIIDKYGDKRLYNDKGELHREDGPAVECVDGYKSWWINGKRHREDGPAIEWIDGGKSWWINGERHREDGAAIEYNDGCKEWHHNGKCIGHSWDGFTQEDFDRYLRSLKIKEYW